MSIELPEASILTAQMNEVLIGKIIVSYYITEYERLQKFSFINKDIDDFKQLIDGKINNIITKGNVIVVKLSNKTNLLLGLEYGGRINYHETEKTMSQKFHLKITFSDRTFLVIRLTGMGVLMVVSDANLQQVYVYKRDHLDKISPLDIEVFTYDYFSQNLLKMNQMLKSVLIGKKALLSGFGNSAFQEIAYLAKIHPKRKASTLSSLEQKALFNAINTIVKNRIQNGGKEQFYDLYGNQGKYRPIMGSHIKKCLDCNENIEKVVIAGGPTYYCSKCQI